MIARVRRWWQDREDRKIEERLDDAVEAWHSGAGMGLKLHDFLGMTWGEYAHWTQTGEIPARLYEAMRRTR